MSRDYYHEDDIDDYELVEDQIEQPDLFEEVMDDLEIPDVQWKEDIERITDLDLKLKEIQEAEKFITEKKALDDSLDNGEISLGAYDSIIRPRTRKASTRCGLESVGLTYDQLGDLSEDNELLPKGLEMIELKDRLKDTIDDIGPDAAEELADEMHDDDEIGDDAHDLISRQIRIRRGNRGTQL